MLAKGERTSLCDSGRTLRLRSEQAASARTCCVRVTEFRDAIQPVCAALRCDSCADLP